MKQVKIGIVGIVNLPLTELNAFQEDIKTLPEDGYRRLRTSILEDSFAFCPHVFQDAEGRWWLLDGHQRYTALTRMAEEPDIALPSSFPCVEVTAESLEHARRLVLSAASQHGVFSTKAVIAFAQKIGITPLQAVDRIALPGVDLTKLFNIGAGSGGSGNEEHIPPKPKNPVTKLGDVILLGQHRLYCGDSTRSEAVMEAFNGVGVNAKLCFTSPPYAEQREYGGGKELSTEYLAKFITAAKGCVDLFAVNLGYARKNSEVVPYWDDYIAEAKRASLKFLSWNIWDRGSPFSVGQHNAMFPIEHEWIFVFGKEARKINLTVENKTAGTRSGRDRREKDGTLIKKEAGVVREHRALGTVVRMGQDKNRDTEHPAKFPVTLPESYIEALTAPGDFIYEPFAGSGSTCIAAQKLGRRCVMIEIDPGYCDTIVERWEKYTGLKAERLNAPSPKV